VKLLRVSTSNQVLITTSLINGRGTFSGFAKQRRLGYQVTIIGLAR